MSSILIITLWEALATPSTLKALARKTGYSPERVLATITAARADGYGIRAVSRGKYAETEPTYYERVSNDG